MKSALRPFVVFVLAFAVSACAPNWDPPEGYKGGFLMGADAPRTVTVKRGDSVYLIARRYNVPMKAIIQTNKLEAPYVLFPGQVLTLTPPQAYTVQRGDSLYAISRKFGVDMRALAQKNTLQAPYTIFPGQKLLVPLAYATASASAPPPASSASNAKTQPRRGPSNTRPVASAPPPVAPPAPPARAGSRFVWPAEGKILAKFGPSGKGLHNDGINIDVPKGTSVRAAENGVVAYSGNELQGFGNLLLVKHADGWMSAYAHNDELMVKRGEQVKRGQIISKAGSSGNVRSPQVHFELRRGTKAVDPLKYLASQRS